MIYIETKRLHLRDFETDDINELYDYRNNEMCTRFQHGQLNQKSDLINLIKRVPNYTLQNDGKKQFAVALKSSDILIGEVVVLINKNEITIGYTISYKHHRNGYAFEILSSLLQYLHNEHPDKKIIALTDKDNIASIRLLEKLKFNNEGYSKDTASLVFSFSA